jgi:hypothetical protein
LKTGLRKIAWEDVDEINLAEDRDMWQAVVKTVVNLPGLLNARNFLTNWGVS